MKTMEELRYRIANVEDVQSIVSMMKTMAAVHIRQYESAADAIAEYLRTIELGFHVLLRDRPIPGVVSPSPTEGAIIFGSDQGLCGKFNEVVANWAVSETHASQGPNDVRSIVVGKRVAQYIDPEIAGFGIEKIFRVPTTVDDIISLLQELMPYIESWRSNGVNRISVYFNTRTSAATFSPETFQLFPIPRSFLERCKSRKWQSRGLPIHTMHWNELFSSVVRQYLLVGLYRACAESRASENASRIASMQTASKNIDHRLSDLRRAFNETRQAAITEEILDIAAGVEALKDV